MYVPLSFDIPRQSRIFRGRSCVSASSSRTSTAVDGGFNRHLGKRQRLDAFPTDVLFRDRLVRGVLEGQVLEAMCRARGIEKIAHQHRVSPEPGKHDAMAAEDDGVELEVVAGLDDR